MSSIEKMMERLAQQEKKKQNGSGAASASVVVSAPLPERAVEKLAQPQTSGPVEESAAHENSAARREQKPLELQLDRFVAAGYLPADYEASRQFSEFRQIKRPILKKAFAKEPVEGGLPRNMVMISSAVPGEGKTFCAINLTLNMILERDITVMLMDVDCMRRSLSKIFGVEALPGLVEVLEGDRNIEDVIINTAIPKLKILPAGRAHQHTAELLAGDRMKRLAKELAERYSDRIILMDAPPLLAANDAEIISHYAGQAMIVVEAGKTSQSLIQQALACIDTTQTETGLVLNKRLGGILAENDSYGYGYYGDYHSGDEASGKG